MADPRALSDILSSAPGPWNVECILTVDSTNLELARRYGKSKTAPRLILWSEEQTAGKGRLNRKWFSVPSLDITSSVCFPAPALPSDVPKLNLVAGVALVDVLRREYGIAAQARWPNDVLTGRGKIAGILSTYLSVPDAVITGIGINVNSDRDAFDPGEHSARTTLRAELGRDISREALFGAWLIAFEERWPLARSERIEDLREAFDPISFYRGRRVRLLVGAASTLYEEAGPSSTEEFEGVAGSIDGSGALLVDTDDGISYAVTIDDVLIPMT